MSNLSTIRSVNEPITRYMHYGGIYEEMARRASHH